jgi:hypothetical protein
VTVAVLEPENVNVCECVHVGDRVGVGVCENVGVSVDVCEGEQVDVKVCVGVCVEV